MTKQGNGIKCLFSLLLGLLLVLQFLNKRCQTFLIRRFVMISKTKIQIIPQPFSVMKMGRKRYAFFDQRRIIKDLDFRGDRFRGILSIYA